ncbi:hypothetical protein T492DRAFT_841487 [Pavlovales sp. CCMP2436]|nr:hypothetical protein T492DRAFT_841487 [Pavlovales sp. CCMP2436]
MVTGLLVDIGTRDLCQEIYYKANWKHLFIYSEGDDQIYEVHQTPAIMSRYILYKQRKQAKKEEMSSNQSFEYCLNVINKGRARRFENSDLLDCYNFGDFNWIDGETATGYLVDSDTNSYIKGLSYKATMTTLEILDNNNNNVLGVFETPTGLKHYMDDHKNV